VECVLEQPGGRALVDIMLHDRRDFRDLTAAAQFATECLRLLRGETLH
jgi:hypothetical protein